MSPKFYNRLMPVAIFVTFLGFLIKGLYLSPLEKPLHQIGRSIPKFQLFDLEQNPITETVMKGQLTLLHIFASWCSTCQYDHAFLMSMKKPETFNIVGLVYKDTLKNITEWFEQSGDPHQFTIVDERGELAMDLGVYGTPEYFLIDKQGIIQFRYVGELNDSVWNEIIQPKILDLS